jgi:hypothetical protein
MPIDNRELRAEIIAAAQKLWNISNKLEEQGAPVVEAHCIEIAGNLLENLLTSFPSTERELVDRAYNDVMDES